MREQKEILIQLNNGNIEKCFLIISESPPWIISLTYKGYKDLSYQADDLFEALKLMREFFEPLGIKMLCNGAREDVVSSGMSREMGGGRKAYVIQKGHPANIDEMVDIFDFAEPQLIMTVQDQEQFHNAWIDSLRDLNQ